MPMLIRILLLAILSGCASQPLSPVPVESRTRPEPAVQPPVAQRPAPAPAPAPAAPVVRTEPVRPSGVQVKPLVSPGSAEKSASAKEPPDGGRRPSAEPQRPEGRMAGSGGRPEIRPESSGTGVAESSEAAPPAPKAEAKPESSFIWPARGKVIQSFSEPRNMGIAIAGNPGDPVQAVADGRVIFSGPGPRGYGNLLILKHDADTLSVYAHNRALLVKEGAQVRRGQQIAELGESGTDRPKLHFEIRRSGKPVDPVKLLPPR
jgi:lipoprotein NlpD